MREIFVNLKRFDVPAAMGGICPKDDPVAWVNEVMDAAIASGLGDLDGINVTFFFAEALIPTAVARLGSYAAGARRTLRLGCQGVYRSDVAPGGNFGAFTTNLPAAAAKALGCSWALVAHSEERRDKLDMLASYDPAIADDPDAAARAAACVDALVAGEARAAFGRGLNVLLCVGETAQERGDGPFEAQKPRIEKVLRDQLTRGLAGVADVMGDARLAIGYEPVWAIGPGKTPPGPAYIGFVSAYIKQVLRQMLGRDIPVVYGGGLKKENAPAISAIDTIDGGLVALTRFVQPVAFEPQGLREIIDAYME
nr:triose-phosphate isomerase family protein [Maliibacterium massiliense]